MPNRDRNHAQSSTWKEIVSQPTTWQTVLEELGRSQIVDRVIADSTVQEEWLFVGCGTSFYLAEAASFSWTTLTGQPSRALPASEVLLYPKSVQTGGRKV